ncbi:salivary glue protein Sgs-3 [Stomoxys calcitrans]|uniref:salivary glue protein Sgs-3 n=1 Tax=Stomoxys calcitrans TaxID=35570 RepID=UPI0027E32E79|nr:salivary glue protein Sgs-3 [Stomoxys calcitrans]
MRFWCSVLIAVVTVNCLVTAINGKSATRTVIEPFNMLLPPLEDTPQDDAQTTKAPALAAAPTTTKRTTTTTAKPLTNNVNNVLPELSIEALLPPLFEAKIEKAEDEHKQQQQQQHQHHQQQQTTTTTRAPQTTTTTTTTTTTPAPRTVAHTQKSPLVKTTKKSYYQQQQQQQQIHSSGSGNKQYPKQKSGVVKNVAETKTKTKQATQHLKSNIQRQATQQVAVKVPFRKKAATTYNVQYNLYGLDVYLASTTPRPPKYGLPTITPFPRRLLG